MSQELAVISVNEVSQMANAIAASGLFGMKTPEQALSLMLIAQAEGRHPALAARDYDIIQGKPAKKAEAMQRDFLTAGGKIEWHKLDDKNADATFSHTQGGSVRITWDMARANAAGLGGKDMWKKYPRQMLRSRVVSEGIRTVFPLATSGMYVPEEVQDFDAKPVTIDQPKEPVVLEQAAAEPAPKAALIDETLAKLTQDAKDFAQEVELCDTSYKLENLVRQNAAITAALATKLPKWHKKLIALIEKQRDALAPAPEESVEEDPARNMMAG